ncbi:MAG: tRNA (uridine(34)/cytosine(34)/5-carboxymethylaminomethyluridine(34)-2'-O)-methyltransferase TrmL [Gammaproteobacteria bacterium]
MFHVVLFRPEIPGNTGNIIRLCANIGARLHLIHPLGFQLEDKQLRRAGLDYHELTVINEHQSLEAFQAAVAPRRLFALSTRGKRHYDEVKYEQGDALIFGQETAGLPAPLLAELGPEHVLRIPMQPGARSLNLGNAAAIVLYEAWRQLGFK